MNEPSVHVLHRPRRLRASKALRALTAETNLRPEQLVLPVFVRQDASVGAEIASLPGVSRYLPEEIPRMAERASDLKLGGLLLFGVPSAKDDAGAQAWSDEGPVPRALRAIAEAVPEMILMADVCLCAYTAHGHCGILKGDDVDNDATLPLLGRTAVAYARAGASVVAPSAMMDGQVAALRSALDRAGLSSTSILSYAAKYASSFYGPFRDAARSAPRSGDRQGYQIQPANVREAIREIELDAAEGADMVMVKPAMPCLDVVRAARDAVELPLAAYQVSGEYAMLEAAAARGWLDRRAAIMESLLAIRRAGADFVITYFAQEAAAWLHEKA
jgi:porphobilinogen synthase